MRTTPAICFASLVLALGYCVSAQATPYFFDGFDVSANTRDINADLGAPRQGGAPAPVSWTANSADYHLQMFGGGGPLQLAGDANPPFPGTTLASPSTSFTGFTGSGEVIGRKVEVTMDAYANNAGGTYFTSSAITVASSAPLSPSGGTGGNDGFSVVFVEDTFAGNGNFIQLWDGSDIVGNLIPNPAGTGPGFVEIFIDDFGDGNPWDGVGSTSFGVAVNGVAIGGYTRGAGGYTSNYITLEGQANTVGVQLATHTFDNLLVSSFPLPIPEPTAALLGLIGFTAVGLKRR